MVKKEMVHYGLSTFKKKLRNIFYRLINYDFFTKSKMLKFKMTDSAECRLLQ